MAGLIPDNANIRLQGFNGADLRDQGVQIDTTPDSMVDDSQPVIGDDGGKELFDDKGNVIRIEYPDGSIMVSVGGKPIRQAEEAPRGWYSNLAEEINEMELNIVANDLLTAIDADNRSRAEWLETVAEGIKLLGTKLNMPSANSPAEGAAVEGMSTVVHPALLQAVLRFQANARSEFLPTDGPVKIRDDNNNTTSFDDQLAEAFQKDFNHYLTVTAKEFYPDTDRMLLFLGFSGMSFKKIYFCPIRNRPVSERVDAEDLIVNDDATSLATAKRITHAIKMSPTTVRRMQLLGAYLDIPLADAMPTQPNAVDREKKAQQGVSQATTSVRPQDRDRDILECYCELDLQGFEHKWKGKPSGLPVPYRVTIDRTSRQVLALVRNYKPPPQGMLPEAKQVFVDYTFIPGFGFYGMGLLHIMGNTTNALTAAWREMLDLGMFANFPGFLFAQQNTRQKTSIFRVPPGGGSPIDTGGMAIRDAIMPLPYKTEGMAALMQLTEKMEQTAREVGMTSEVEVGEGKSDSPVGTTLALIDQATKVLNSVHKRMHTSQATELQLLKECFRDNPDSFWKCNTQPAKDWDEQTFLKAVNDCNLVPQSDPNTASHTQRIMKVVALKQLQAGAPTLYDPLQVETEALRVLGYNNPEQFFAPPSAQAKPPPEMQAKQAELAIAKQKADNETMKTQAEVQEIQHKVGLGAAELQMGQQKMQHEQGLAGVKLNYDVWKTRQDVRSKQNAEFAKTYTNLIDMAQNVAVHPESAALVEPLIRPAFEEVRQHQARQEQESEADTPPTMGTTIPDVPQ